jgi:hypothetical protein
MPRGTLNSLQAWNLARSQAHAARQLVASDSLDTDYDRVADEYDHWLFDSPRDLEATVRSMPQDPSSHRITDPLARRLLPRVDEHGYRVDQQDVHEWYVARRAAAHILALRRRTTSLDEFATEYRRLDDEFTGLPDPSVAYDAADGLSTADPGEAITTLATTLTAPDTTDDSTARRVAEALATYYIDHDIDSIIEVIQQFPDVEFPHRDELMMRAAQTKGTRSERVDALTQWVETWDVDEDDEADTSGSSPRRGSVYGRTSPSSSLR